MFARVILCLVFVSIVCACKNEPYDEKPLGVIGLLNHASNTNYSFKYRDQKLYSFLSVRGTDTLARMKFYYSGDRLTSIVSDSTATFRKLTTFHDTGSNTVVDSTFLLQGGLRIPISVRTIVYGTSGYPDLVTIRTTAAVDTFSEERAELTWEDDNVVKLVTFDINDEKKEMTIGYDNRSSVYMRNPVYLFTLNPTEYYWLSANNPNVFNSGQGDKKYAYWYNRMGYPSNFKTDTDVLFGASYTQVR